VLLTLRRQVLLECPRVPGNRLQPAANSCHILRWESLLLRSNMSALAAHCHKFPLSSRYTSPVRAELFRNMTPSSFFFSHLLLCAVRTLVCSRGRVHGASTGRGRLPRDRYQYSVCARLHAEETGQGCLAMAQAKGTANSERDNTHPSYFPPSFLQRPTSPSRHPHPRPSLSPSPSPFLPSHEVLLSCRAPVRKSCLAGPLALAG